MYKSKGRYKSENMSLTSAIRIHLDDGLSVEEIIDLYPKINKKNIKKVVDYINGE